MRVQDQNLTALVMIGSVQDCVYSKGTVNRASLYCAIKDMLNIYWILHARRVSFKHI